MNLTKENTKKLVLMTCGVLLFYCALQNLGAVTKFLTWILGIFMPFFVGCAIAFIINVPMKHLEKHLGRSKKAFVQNHKRMIAFLLTIVLLVVILALAMLAILPELANSIAMLIRQVPVAFNNLQKELEKISVNYPQIESYLQSINIDWGSMIQKVTTLIQKGTEGLFNSGMGFISNIVTTVMNLGIGMIFAIYLLFQKETLGGQLKQVMYALLPDEKTKKILHVNQVADRIFSNFLTGQCLEAMILGSMFFITLSILRLPYAVLIGVMIALLALIPMVGAMLGLVLGTLLILMVNPIQAVIFVITFFVLQQIEGNLIYPRVVGSSVGLPSIWVLVAVTVGGNLLGIIGMLIFIPLCSVMYSLFREYIKGQLHIRKPDGIPQNSQIEQEVEIESKKKQKTVIKLKQKAGKQRN